MSKDINIDGLTKTLIKVDGSVLNYFQSTLGLVNKENNEKIPVIWVLEEKWRLVKNNKFLRDANGSIILPIITVGNMGVANDPTSNLLAALPSTERLNVTKPEIISNDTKNGLEFVINTIKYPQQLTCNYQINIWAQYLSQMNSIIEQIVSNQIFQQSFVIYDKESDKYRYTALLEYSINSQDNLSNVELDERIIIKTINFKITFPLITEKSNYKKERLAMKIVYNEVVK